MFVPNDTNFVPHFSKIQPWPLYWYMSSQIWIRSYRQKALVKYTSLRSTYTFTWNSAYKKRFVPLIKKYYNGDQYVFWPDLASLRYANSVQDWLEEQSISFLAKKDNPANLPEARPIINSWWGIPTVALTMFAEIESHNFFVNKLILFLSQIQRHKC